MRLSLVQITVGPQVDKNFQKVDRFINQALSFKPDLILLPECFLFLSNLTKRSFTMDHEYILHYQNFAKINKVNLLLGSLPILDDGKVYNRSGNYVESFSTASSPEAIKMYYSQATGILSFSTQTEQQYSLYPNPAKNHFSVNGALDSETTIQIFGTNGKLVKQMSQVNEFNQIDISELSSGLYIVNIFHKGEVATEKLMVR